LCFKWEKGLEKLMIPGTPYGRIPGVLVELIKEVKKGRRPRKPHTSRMSERR